MGIKKHIKNSLNSLLKRYDHEIIASRLLYDWQKSFQRRSSYKKAKLPEGAEDYLQQKNPRFRELREKYSIFNQDVTEPLVWTNNHVSSDDIRNFRGDNAFVWQLRGPNMNIMSYALSTYYIKAIDNLCLFDKLAEDDYFGIFTFLIDDQPISRDLLDSIIEIYFLEKHLNISRWSNLKILDIGAGYGRLAHRMVNAFHNIDYYLCTDAVSISTFISEYYLRFRNVHDKAKVIPLYDIEDVLTNHSVDIAINVHSFSECKVSAIDWWLTVLERNRIKYLMIVPNSLNHGRGKLLLTIDFQDFLDVVEWHGYKLIAKEPKYRDATVQEYGINPAYHYLFELC
ncbi:MAG: hypothetical protein SCARUB_01645 [Candidatus Scalindua rubra]|uniref:Sugar O-methyltransferase n=1 Tax=Candidatus Scalindua rubra TaxID=1872076 RepID=A0A1E3XE85_9BACT|nr:MAG: hypothetical protein SCARUB_01645 [Candidatus Scalindua rubra]